MDKQLHVFFFPMMAHGHMIPTLDMAKLFASHGAKSTIITTTLNASVFAKPVERSRNLGLDIDIHLFKFPAEEVGLPEGCECVDKVPSNEMFPKFLEAIAMLQDPLEKLLEERRPNCLVADMFFPWATGLAAKFGIPRLIFHGTSYFSLSVSESLMLYKPFKNITSDTEPFIVPNLPHEIKLTRMQLSDYEKEEDNKLDDLIEQIFECERNCFGTIFNSFYELEPNYADYFRQVIGKRAWQIGPFSLCNRDIEDKLQRGKESSINEHECLRWLDSKNPNSVIYVCFGSVSEFTASQLFEIAMGLEASEQQFIWVVRGANTEEENKDQWQFLEGFEERIKEKGLIIKGWAPQMLILEHEAVGSFVTHCGWNSTLEGICAGVSMVTWPIFAEQFYNEKLVTEILKIGIAIGANKWCRIVNDSVNKESIAKAVKMVMVGEEAEEMRKRVIELKEMAKKAVEEGGSSNSSLKALIAELTEFKS